MLRTTLDQNFVKLSDAGVLTLEQQAAERKDYAALVRETGLDLGAAELLHDRWTSARLERARAGGDNVRDLEAQIYADQRSVTDRVARAVGREGRGRFGRPSGPVGQNPSRAPRDHENSRDRLAGRRRQGACRTCARDQLPVKPDICEGAFFQSRRRAATRV